MCLKKLWQNIMFVHFIGISLSAMVKEINHKYTSDNPIKSKYLPTYLSYLLIWIFFEMILLCIYYLGMIPTTKSTESV